MGKEKLLLAVVNFGEETTLAIERAALLAPQLDAEVELFASCYDEHIAGTRFYDSPDLSAARDSMVAGAVDQLETLARPLRERGLKVSTFACWDRPEHEAVVRRARKRRAWMVLRDCRYHSAISRAIFSHEDWQLVRTCPCPLLLVKEHHTYHDAPRIWAAVDPLQRHEKPQTLDRDILTIAGALARGLHGTLDVVHTFDPAAALAAAAAPAVVPVALPLEEITEEMRENHLQHLRQLTEPFDVPAEHVHNLQGSAREMLPAVAISNRIDVLVMGAVARTGLDKLIIGSTAEKILDHVPCDVLVVKPGELFASLQVPSPAVQQGVSDT